MGTPSHVDCLDVARRLRIRALKLHNNIIEGILMEEYTVDLIISFVKTTNLSK